MLLQSTPTDSDRSSDAIERARAVSAVASEHADDVDRQARFPAEAVQAMREASLLSAIIPTEFGGDGSNMRELAAITTAIAQGCSSAGMVYAMHVSQVACLVRHAQGDHFFASYLSELADRQLLLASVTSEVGVSGDTRSSVCALERKDQSLRLVKDATTVSYGAFPKRATDVRREDWNHPRCWSCPST